MKKIILILVLNLLSYFIYSQEFKVINFDFTNFPEVSILFEATDETGKIITNAQLSDFKIEENNKKYYPAEIHNPDGGLAPVSVALIVDNSGSMDDNGRLDLVKRGISIFLKSFPFETSEIALESFSDDIIVNTDFTQKPERVMFTLNSISPLTGTNFNNAFLKTSEGAIELMQNAVSKKILIFITDGLSSANAKDIADKAISSGIEVYSLIIQLNSPKDLKNISTMTGGYTVEGIPDEIKLAGCLDAIIRKSQISRFGTLKWVTDNNCNVNRSLKITFNNIPVTTSYIVPSDKIAALEINPSTLYFETVKQGSPIDAQIEIVPHRGVFNITGLNITKPEIFSIEKNSLLYEPVFSDSTLKVKIFCELNDNIQVVDNLRISTKECPDKTIKLIAGNEEKLQIIRPSGGEVFVPGMDTIIQWDGISGNRKVDIFFRSSPGKKWKKIDLGSRWLYNWLIPKDTCKDCQIKLSPGSSGLFELKPVKTLEFQGYTIKSAIFNADGNYLVSNDDGYVVVWNTRTGLKERVYGGFKYENAAFYDENNTLVLFNKDKITLLRNDNNIPSTYTFKDKKVFTSMCFDNGNEELISAYLLSDKAGFQRIWMPGTSNVFFVDVKHSSTSAAFSPTADYVVTFEENSSLNCWDTKTKKLVTSYSLPRWFKKAIIGNSALVALTGNNNITMLSLPTFDVLWNRVDLNYIKFSGSGKQLIASDTSGKYCFIDCNDGKTMFSFHDYIVYQCSPVNSQILHYSNDTLVLFDANKKKNILKFVDPEVKDCRFNPDGLKVLVLNGKNEIDIYNVNNGQLEETVTGIISQANSTAISPDIKRVAVTLSNGKIQLFEKVSINNVKEAISNTFSIISPEPLIEDTIDFGDKYINQDHELMIGSFARNNSRFPVRLTGMEFLNNNQKVFSNLLTQFPVELDSMQSFDCEFKFSPEKIGHYEAYLKTYTPTDTFTTLMKGNASKDPVNIDAFDINFGRVNVNSFKDTLAILLINNGLDTIESEYIVNAGPDTIQFTLLPFSKKIKTAPGKTLICNIRFAPKFRGLTTGYLYIYIKGKNTPQRIRLTGNGLAPRIITVKGTVRNVLDSMPLTSDLFCNDLLSNRTIITQHTNSTGQFCLTLNSDRNYSLVASKTNYISSSENIDLSDNISTDTIYSDIWLTEIKSGGVIKFNCIFFEFAKSTLEDISKNDLNRIVKMLLDNKSVSIEIHGHTDYIGSDSSNMILSAERAKAVKEYIINKGISASRMKIFFYGERIPVSDNNTPEGRKANRRVEFKIVENIKK